MSLRELALDMAIMVTAVSCLAGSAFGTAVLDWQSRAYGDGRHNAFTDLILWKGQCYLCFRHGASHLSMDGEIRVMRSPDMKQWEPCGTLDTLGDDRDPHFAATPDRLYVYFGTWDLVHAQDNGVPDRGRIRSYFASSEDGVNWSGVQGVYETGWWLWRVRWLKGAFYSAAYSVAWPSAGSGELRLLRSEDGSSWHLVSVISNERLPDESDYRFLPDGSMEIVTRTGDHRGNAMLFRSDPDLQNWRRTDLDTLIHSPVMLAWKDRCFVSGRGHNGEKFVTRVWELKGDSVETLVTLSSDGDNAYPGLLPDPAAADAANPSFLVSWYSQHERTAEAPDEASIYVGRITVKPD